MPQQYQLIKKRLWRGWANMSFPSVRCKFKLGTLWSYLFITKTLFNHYHHTPQFNKTSVHIQMGNRGYKVLSEAFFLGRVHGHPSRRHEGWPLKDRYLITMTWRHSLVSSNGLSHPQEVQSMRWWNSCFSRCVCLQLARAGHRGLWLVFWIGGSRVSFWNESIWNDLKGLKWHVFEVTTGPVSDPIPVDKIMEGWRRGGLRRSAPPGAEREEGTNWALQQSTMGKVFGTFQERSAQ